jgi:CBS domain-containing protein
VASAPFFRRRSSGPAAVASSASSSASAKRSWAAFAPALALPVLFLHVNYQPKLTVGLGSTTVGIELSDVAVLGVVATAVVVGVREGWGPLRAARWLWICEAIFLALVVLATTLAPLREEHYRFLTHLVTAAKFCEYALLAPALALILRAGSDAFPLLWSMVGWSLAATGWALLQFAGLVNELQGKRPLQREPSFLGIHDLAAVSGAALAIAFVVIAGGSRGGRSLAVACAAGAAGVIGLVLSSAVAGTLGVGLAALLALAVARAKGLLTVSRALTVTSVAVVAGAAVVLMRSGNIVQSIRAAGIGSKPKPQVDVASYVHRSLLAYIGIRMFADHPVIGVGWQGSEELENYGPYLADARRRFPEEPAVAFPSPEHAWGVQNAYLQTLTDLGIVGFAALVAVFVAAVGLGVRAALRAPPALLLPALVGTLWLLIAVGVWNFFNNQVWNGVWTGLIGLFLNNAARSSYQQVLIRQALEGEPVSRFMNPDPVTVPPSVDLRRWLDEYVYRYHHKTFPVVADGRLLGVISTRMLGRFPREEWGRVTVGEAMRQDLDAVTVPPQTDSMKALERMQRTGLSRLLVTRDHQLAGIISLKDLLRFLQLKLELEEPEERPPDHTPPVRDVRQDHGARV